MRKDDVFLAMVKAAAKASTCPRQEVGALLVDMDGRIKGHGYNGTVAGGPNLCGGSACLRDTMKIASGTRYDVGCIHAEMNLIINAERRDLIGGTVYLNLEPCIGCAKLLAQAGVERVVCINNGYSHDGIDLLEIYGVTVDIK